MWPFLGSIFIASLCGSVHCVGMCGPFVACYAATDDARLRNALVHAAYHGGRLVTYVTLGLLAGFAGRAVDLAGELAGLQRGAAIVAGLMMIGWGLAHLLGVRRTKSLGPPGPVRRLVTAGLRAIADCPPGLRGFAIGVVTTWLPCGWLYAFVLAAAGTASPVFGAAVMVAFWLGSVPLLLGVGLGVRFGVRILSTNARRVLPALTAGLLMLVGGWMIATAGTALPAPPSAATTTANPEEHPAVPEARAVHCPRCAAGEADDEGRE